MARPNLRCLAALLPAALLLAGAAPAFAQSTDGYHTIQFFPVVVDSASFVQRFTFRNPDPASAITISATYYPGTGLAQTSPTTCNPITVPKDGETDVASLRALCPGIAAGNAFGYLYTAESSAANHPYAAFSRVSNIAGAGFSVEGFPAHTFTSADTDVSGLRRLAATAGAPAYQTNCFIGNVNQVDAPTSSVQTQVFYALFDAAGTQIGSLSSVTLVPGQLTRLLDVFAAVGAPAGNYDNVRAVFSSSSPEEPGLMTFCTVQDNTSFGADFRIGKQLQGYTTQASSIGAQDDAVSRDSTIYQDVFASGEVSPRQFDLPAGASSNTHVIYFRHPDRVQCELVDNAGTRLTAASGLEMRMLDSLATPVAGGSDVTGFSEVYLGDKNERNNGANGRYTIEVENTATGASGGVARSYGLHCQSGSGHSMPDVIRFHEAVDRF